MKDIHLSLWEICLLLLAISGTVTWFVTNDVEDVIIVLYGLSSLTIMMVLFGFMGDALPNFFHHNGKEKKE